jgi:ribonucleoside-diphosphate reductase alpha chain
VLRNGLPVEEVVHLVSSLELDSQTINNWRTGVERALKRYIPNGTKDTSGSECEKCGAKNLIYQEGCLLCMSCGYSKCG